MNKDMSYRKLQLKIQYDQKPIQVKLLLAIILTVINVGWSEENNTLTDGRFTLNLSGPKWQMEGIRPGQGITEGFHEAFGEVAPSTYNWNGATIPGDVYTDLWRAGEIDDPHYGRNGMRAKWVMEKEWWYRHQFGVPETFKDKIVNLVFEGVDYSCDVWLNGTHLGHHEGMFSSFEFDVSSVLRYRSDRRANCLVVRLDPPPRLYRNVAGRKFAWHGDYWRALTPFGIWKPIKLIATGAVQIKDVHPKTTISDNGSANVEFQLSIANHNPKQLKEVLIQAVVNGKNFECNPSQVQVKAPVTNSINKTNLSVTIPQAKLWWPWELGSPNLYTVEIKVLDASGALFDRVETTFGIREIHMERNPGYSKEEVKYPWTLVINGRRLFLRSANWGGPPNIFYGRNSVEKYRKLINLAKDANINNLRIFGWHPTEVDAFYQLCDELGITVWQDLIPLASVSLPQDESFRKATYKEAVAVIKKLRNHPCLVLLEGGEEMFYGTQGLEYNVNFLLGLEKAIRPYTDLPYVPTSPLNWPSILHDMGVGGRKDSAHTHELFYAMGRRLMEDYVPTWDYAVIPEFAISSAPCVESIRKFIPPEELWPPGPSWGYHWADLDVFRALNFQVFGNEQTDSLEEFVEATQISQGTIFQWGIEYMRRRKPKSSAISICHFITFAPDMKWGIVDYYQVPKLSYKYVKRAYQPLLVSLELAKRRWLPGEMFKCEIWIVNDLHKEFKDCKLSIKVSNSRGRRIFERTNQLKTIPADSSAHYGAFEWKVRGKLGESFRVEAALRDDTGRTISANHYVLLIADQQKARKECRERAEQMQEVKSRFPTADYYRFYPELLEVDRKK
jgi:beta-mannosidase